MKIVHTHTQGDAGGIEAKSPLQLLDTLFEIRLWNGVIVLVTVLTPISVLRVLVSGWLPIYTVHVAVLGVMLAVHFMRRRIPQRTLTVIALVYLLSMGALGLVTYGLMGFGCLWLLVGSFLAGGVFGIRIGLIVVMANLVLIAVVMILFTHGVLTVPVSASLYMKSSIVWVLALIMMTATPLMVLFTLVQHMQANHRLYLQVEKQRREIEHLAMHDALTGLVSNRLAQDRLNLALKHASRTGTHAALLFIDLDGFKRINDEFGHAAGDELLRIVGKVLQAAVRECDTVARVGGDEFLVVLQDLKGHDMARHAARRILAGIREPVQYGKHSLQVGASIGVAIFPDHGQEPATLLKAADAAMYSVKTSGKNAVAIAISGTETGEWTRPPVSEAPEKPAERSVDAGQTVS